MVRLVASKTAAHRWFCYASTMVKSPAKMKTNTNDDLASDGFWEQTATVQGVLNYKSTLGASEKLG